MSEHIVCVGGLCLCFPDTKPLSINCSVSLLKVGVFTIILTYRLGVWAEKPFRRELQGRSTQWGRTFSGVCLSHMNTRDSPLGRVQLSAAFSWYSPQEAGHNVELPLWRSRVFVYSTLTPSSALFMKSSLDTFVCVFHVWGTSFSSWDVCIL